MKREIPHGINHKEFLDDTFRLGSVGLSHKYKVGERTIRRWKQSLKERGIPCGSGEFPEATGRTYDDQLRFEAARMIVMGDCEIPDHDASMFDLVVSVAEAWGIKTLVINGDFAGQDNFSRWARQTPKTRKFTHEIDASRGTLTEFLKTFETIYYINGNHDRRLTFLLEGQLSFGDLLSDIYGVKISEYAYAYAISGGQPILICHQDNYSQIPLSVPLRLSSIYHMNIICGHTHRLCLGFDKSGQYWLAESGHCRDVSKTSYKSLRINTHPAWNAGFIMILEGTPHLIYKSSADFWVAGARTSEDSKEETMELK